MPQDSYPHGILRSNGRLYATLEYSDEIIELIDELEKSENILGRL